MDKSKCFNCGDTPVTAYAGKDEFPLCTECWYRLYIDELSLETLEKKLQEKLNEQTRRTL